MTSWAKTRPARGALNAVEIAAATPQPTHMVGAPLGVPVEAGEEGAEGPSEVGERAVLADRGPGGEGDEARQGGEESGAGRHAPVHPLDGADDVGGTVGTPLRDEVVVHQPDDEPARGGDADGGGEEQGPVLLHEAAAGRDEQPLVEEEDEVHEPDRGERGHRPHHHAEGRVPEDPRGRAQLGAHRPLTSPPPTAARSLSLDLRPHLRTVFMYRPGDQ